MRIPAFALALVPTALLALDGPYHVSRQRNLGNFNYIDDQGVMASGNGQLLKNGRRTAVSLAGADSLRIRGYTNAGHLYGYRQYGTQIRSFIVFNGVEYALGSTLEPVMMNANGTVFALGFGPTSWNGGPIRYVNTGLLDELGNTVTGTNLGTSAQGYALVGLTSLINGIRQTINPSGPYQRMEATDFAADGTVYGVAVSTPNPSLNLPFRAKNNAVVLGDLPGVPPLVFPSAVGGLRLRDGWIPALRRASPAGENLLHLMRFEQSVLADELLLTPEQRATFQVQSLSWQNSHGQIVGILSFDEPAGTPFASGSASALLTPAHLVQSASSTTPGYRTSSIGQTVEFKVDLPAEGGPFEVDWIWGPFGMVEPIQAGDPMTYGPISGLGTNTLQFTPNQAGFRSLTARAFNRYQAEVFSKTFRINVLGAGQTVQPPVLNEQPGPQFKRRGEAVSVGATFISYDALTLRVYRDGRLVGTREWYPDSTPYSLVMHSLGTASYQTAGQYVITATNSAGQASTQPFRITVEESSTTRLANLSTRARVGTGEQALIAGFAVRGGQKRLLVRSLGPSLQPFGIADFLPDPKISVYNSAGQKIRENDDWTVAGTEVQATGLAPSNARESAAVLLLDAGTYTVIVEGKDGATGLAIVELYDLDPGGPGRLSNLSTRAYVGLDADVVIGGFVLGSGDARPHLVRAMGPTLANFGVQSPLQDPNLELNVAGQALLRSDDWRNRTQAGEIPLIEAAGLAPASERESVIYGDLSPRAYTAIVRGSTTQTGVALIEIYELP